LPSIKPLGIALGVRISYLTGKQIQQLHHWWYWCYSLWKGMKRGMKFSTL